MADLFLCFLNYIMRLFYFPHIRAWLHLITLKIASVSYLTAVYEDISVMFCSHTMASV